MITQRLILDGPPPDGVWACIGCSAHLTEGRLEHPDDCPELIGIVRASAGKARARAGVTLIHFRSPDYPQATACGLGVVGPPIQMQIAADRAAVTCGRCRRTDTWKRAAMEESSRG